jgi:hypothetical protein
MSHVNKTEKKRILFLLASFLGSLLVSLIWQNPFIRPGNICIYILLYWLLLIPSLFFIRKKLITNSRSINFFIGSLIGFFVSFIALYVSTSIPFFGSIAERHANGIRTFGFWQYAEALLIVNLSRNTVLGGWLIGGIFTSQLSQPELRHGTKGHQGTKGRN